MSQSTARSLRLLLELGDGERSLDQLALAVGVHKSTVLRLLRTLEEQAFVRHDAQHRYRLGPRILDLAHRSLDQRDVRRVAAPHLSALSGRTGHSVHLAILESDEVVYVDKHEGGHPVRMWSHIGKTVPLHATAVAKVLVAALPEVERRRLVAGMDFHRYTEATICGPSAYFQELDRVRQRGCAVDRGEYERHIACIAMPVRDGEGQVVAAMSVSVATTAVDPDGVLALRGPLQRACEAASADFGWVPRRGERPGGRAQGPRPARPAGVQAAS